MMDEEDKKTLQRVLSAIGLKAISTLSSVNTKIFYIASKKTGRIVLEKTENFYFSEAWGFKSEEDLTNKLFSWIIEFREDDAPKNQFWKNPYFGCNSLEEAAVKADLIEMQMTKI